MNAATAGVTVEQCNAGRKLEPASGCPRARARVRCPSPPQSRRLAAGARRARGRVRDHPEPTGVVVRAGCSKPPPLLTRGAHAPTRRKRASRLCDPIAAAYLREKTEDGRNVVAGGF